MTLRMTAAGALLAGFATLASAQNSLNVLCPVQSEGCSLAATEF